MALDEHEHGNEFGSADTEVLGTHVDVRSPLGGEALRDAGILDLYEGDVGVGKNSLFGPRTERDSIRYDLERMELKGSIDEQLPAAYDVYVKAVNKYNAGYPYWSEEANYNRIFDYIKTVDHVEAIREDYEYHRSDSSADIKTIEEMEAAIKATGETIQKRRDIVEANTKLQKRRDLVDADDRLLQKTLDHVEANRMNAIREYNEFQSMHRLPVEDIEDVKDMIERGLRGRLESIVEMKSGQEVRLVIAPPSNYRNEAAAIAKAKSTGADFNNLPSELYVQNDRQYGPKSPLNLNPVIALVETAPRPAIVSIKGFPAFNAGQEALQREQYHYSREPVTFSVLRAYVQNGGNLDTVTDTVFPYISVGRLESVDVKNSRDTDGAFNERPLDCEYVLGATVKEGKFTLRPVVSVDDKGRAQPMPPVWYTYRLT